MDGQALTPPRRPWTLRSARTDSRRSPGVGAPTAHPFSWLSHASAARARAGLTRRVTPRAATEHVLDLAGNDYLGLLRHPRVAEAAEAAIRRWGTGAGGSRLVTGDTELHHELERELADHLGTESALVFSSGYTANLAMVTALTAPFPQAGPTASSPLLVCDRHNHASLIDATRLARAAGARVALFEHADPVSAARALEGRADDRAARTLVVSDTVFSVDGDLTDLGALHRAARAAGGALLLDDAHGLGVVGPGGRGALSAAGLLPAPDDVVVSVTLSKALAAQGGAVAGPARVVRHLVETARTFIFDTGLAPASAAAALAALRVLRAEPERAEAVRAHARRLHDELSERGCEVTAPDAAVVSVTAPSPEAAVRWRAACLRAGVRVGCFRPPSVPDGRSRLRLTARATLTEAEVRRAVDVIVAHLPG
ncbi:8-amino-7-oxononanoate synthase [Nocardiopsis sp. N85]|uniref:8-amino-7-oxononanoate synthase n=1 Tax=Nocardiopsis sp. N85 TaxID=3029400 RepID=UPI00237F5945|nr:8-amino-7-oxononanoate synthase [Nocardiopsis sp. N85]MDE3719980.1 8-amino-7-oxononanoate synthase [Nocardiopsis sp. N85]